MWIKVAETDGELGNLTADIFMFEGKPAALALAFISPHLDFANVCERLKLLAADTPVVAMSTAGELCSSLEMAPHRLYCATGNDWQSVVIQSFAPGLLSAISVHAIPLPNADIRSGNPAMPHSERVRRIAESLTAVSVPFGINYRDTLALTFVDGLSACESYFMEAVYKTGRFPCLFVGGSAGGKLDFKHTYLFDGCRVLENHAIICFVKLPQDKRYGILKSQNFRKTGTSFIVLAADADRRIVSTVVDPETFRVESACAAMCRLLECSPAELLTRLTGHTFAIELNGETFVRSVASVDFTEGNVSFYCDVNTGDRLFLHQATDFVEQTRRDYAAFLVGKPAPIGALLNDCILRRLSNETSLSGLDGLWNCPTAGFSTFGELLGININQTLSAVFFFQVEGEQQFSDHFVDGFPVHYGNFQNHFTSSRLARLELLNELRSQAGGLLLDYFADMGNPSEEVAPIVLHARMERILRDSRARLLAMTSSLYEGIMLVDQDGRILFANRSASQLMDNETLAERHMDEVVSLLEQNERVDFLHGPLLQTLDTGETVLDEDAFFITKAGIRLNVAYAAAPLMDDGKVLGVILSFRSIEALKKAQRDAAQASRLASVGQLAAGIAHEINTPIQYISDNLSYIHKTFSELTNFVNSLREAVAGTDRTELVEEIFSTHEVELVFQEITLAAAQSLEGAKHVAHIVRSMKAFSYPGTASKVLVNINQAIDSTLVVSRSEWKQVASVETDLAQDLPSVVCYPADINQVLLNLIINAAHAVEDNGSGELGLIRISTRQNGDYVEIRIADNGPGVPTEIRESIFDPFFTTKEVGKGTGQGLSICLDVVTRRHGGQLFLDQDVDCGATFVVRLPLGEHA
ncbi:FIST N-terminal domain-containing protein [Magnetospirillum aberrantis]|uniref:histidine kinase n=1 Tax=Magnetospirillum aberrantis SpK TaxID=908842 RepID=A0A7C9QRY2_9PROT|nr:FIST N-terminal domain-containing protein [Magnetospirillum aberrantis]NFV78984.1 PAS domain S-box protein [Magnetospirillum aberrantis SpK]